LPIVQFLKDRERLLMIPLTIVRLLAIHIPVAHPIEAVGANGSILYGARGFQCLL